jgi:hypothetical protein
MKVTKFEPKEGEVAKYWHQKDFSIEFAAIVFRQIGDTVKVETPVVCRIYETGRAAYVVLWVWANSKGYNARGGAREIGYNCYLPADAFANAAARAGIAFDSPIHGEEHIESAVRAIARFLYDDDQNATVHIHKAEK